MHFGEFINTEDKIIHLLFVANFDSECLYRQAVDECIKKWGILAMNAVKDFELNYKH